MSFLRVSKKSSTAKLPFRKNPTDAGIDLFANVIDYLTIEPHAWNIIPTGISIEIPVGYVGLVFPKSRNDHLIGAGVIDQDYQGEILVKVVNYSDDTLIIANHTPIGQLVIVPCVMQEVVEVPIEELHTRSSARASTGGIVNQYSLIEAFSKDGNFGKDF